ncbi:hypothetical protein L7F22_068789 [Adiantum nelumboides]|nr:hypothetical protein [Adiantum nelumboides]
MQSAIPRLPFQRVMREICKQWRVGMRWASSALLYLQEIAEDYLVEFFSDGYILAAHARRVTIMPQDFDTLWRLCFRYGGLLQLVPIWDMRTMDILNIPPLHPRARQTEPSRARLNNKRTQSWVKRNDTDGQAAEGHEQANEGHEQARVDPEVVIEETETLMEEPIMKENEQGMEDAELVPISEDPMPVRKDLVHVREDHVPIREDPMPIREEPEATTNKAQERQGKGSASQGPSNMEPL